MSSFSSEKTLIQNWKERHTVSTSDILKTNINVERCSLFISLTMNSTTKQCKLCNSATNMQKCITLLICPFIHTILFSLVIQSFLQFLCVKVVLLFPPVKEYSILREYSVLTNWIGAFCLAFKDTENTKVNSHSPFITGRAVLKWSKLEECKTLFLFMYFISVYILIWKQILIYFWIQQAHQQKSSWKKRYLQFWRL